jgi:hypothetical protein
VVSGAADSLSSITITGTHMGLAAQGLLVVELESAGREHR